ncbi:hypothetical protein PXD56_10730 [Maribacter sp. SA7]|uniref:hypothetical protein n=1 Tax=Maribacter zhoushanensis TaxID=3030012 RepID=UPI0023EAB119|nr:hypothetical protein [Maribacter zhoushanensis]MDF4203433.1 hypothetical protein [Maribacter zhoushanensis]
MKKDIEIPVVKDVYVAIIREWNEEFLDKDWNAYVINDKDTAIEMTMVVSKGYDGNRKTSIMRHNLGIVEPKSSKKIEVVQEDVLTLNNEFFVTFFANGTLHDKRFVFEKNTVTESNLRVIPLIEKEGIYAK